jgi:error-prone DNA polymerase
MQLAIAAAGFTPSQADALRRAMGHKRSHERMEAISVALIAGMVKNGFDEKTAFRIYKQMSAFADYGFPESHAASFALLVYVSAYLKVHFPQAFYCSLLNSQPMGFYSPSSIIYEAKRKGLRILGVDVARSSWDCTIEGKDIRLGFRYAKRLGNAAKAVIERESRKGSFSSIQDFAFRTKLNNRALEQLAMIGAFECFGVKRREALWEIMSVVNRTQDELPIEIEDHGKNHLKPMASLERLVADFKGMNLSTGRHPMKLVRAALQRRGVLSSADLKNSRSSATATVAGTVVIRQRPLTAKGFVFLTLEDETGFINVVVKPNIANRFKRIVVSSSALLVRGRVERKNGVINVIGTEFAPLQFRMSELQLKSRDFR